MTSTGILGSLGIPEETVQINLPISTSLDSTYLCWLEFPCIKCLHSDRGLATNILGVLEASYSCVGLWLFCVFLV